MKKTFYGCIFLIMILIIFLIIDYDVVQPKKILNYSYKRLKYYFCTSVR